jgi:CBS domain-containing protein
MLTSMLVKDYMRADPLAFKPGTELLTAVHQLLAHQLSGAPVVDSDGVLIGFFSEKDALKATLNASYYGQPGGPVEQFMTREVITLSGESSLAAAIDLFLSRPFRAYPVVDGRRLIGQLCRADALRALEKLR